MCTFCALAQKNPQIQDHHDIFIIRPYFQTLDRSATPFLLLSLLARNLLPLRSVLTCNSSLHHHFSYCVKKVINVLTLFGAY